MYFNSKFFYLLLFHFFCLHSVPTSTLSHQGSLETSSSKCFFFFSFRY
ncbi:hypothetical protein GLYMA_03G073251v4 [Glycine max]|nr:hypothetical protein GLYMA_03G073251v4 [Glycine max]KAH1068927.1 hypothetical protein GYH30_006489 [Glycine max]